MEFRWKCLNVLFLVKTERFARRSVMTSVRSNMPGCFCTAPLPLHYALYDLPKKFPSIPLFQFALCLIFLRKRSLKKLELKAARNFFFTTSELFHRFVNSTPEFSRSNRGKLFREKFRKVRAWASLRPNFSVFSSRKKSGTRPQLHRDKSRTVTYGVKYLV